MPSSAYLAVVAFLTFVVTLIYIANLRRATAAVLQANLQNDAMSRIQSDVLGVPVQLDTWVVHAGAGADAAMVAQERNRSTSERSYKRSEETIKPTNSLLHESFHMPLMQPNQRVVPNKTKIVGFVSGSYASIAARWYNRLEALGYNNHYIICTDNETRHQFLNSDNSTLQYRTEASYFTPPKLPDHEEQRKSKKERNRIHALFAHRWVYLLEQLNLGYHILLTDVDNIFTSYYSMNELEDSEFDVHLALELKHPTDVFVHQGFVFCGGMGWFRSSPPTIRFIEEMVRRCGDTCEDQELLNQIVAYDLGVKWNRTGEEHKQVTIATEDTNVTQAHFERLVGLVIKGFTGYSDTTGLKIKVWDRDFAYRGKVDPSVCPKGNWVSMPFTIARLRSRARARKERAFHVWDKNCPNDYTNRTRGSTRIT